MINQDKNISYYHATNLKSQEDNLRLKKNEGQRKI